MSSATPVNPRTSSLATDHATASSTAEMAMMCSTLMPQLVKLVTASALAPSADSQTSATNQSSAGQAVDDADARQSKIELARLATQLRSNLAMLKTQAQQIPAGHLSLQDQAWLVEQLEATLHDKKRQLESLKELIPPVDGGQRTDKTLGSDDAVMQVD
ncbi:hypothetical protein ACM66B_002603 [Microbotryomycetes sp. NB124-2]